ncbi:MAG: hypothetical protein AAF429_00425 [Pseudomonadota bacterium]
MKKRVMIVSSGFRGFCDALHLMNNPDLELQIIDSAPFFGGVMHSLDIEGFAVDKGVHIFDSIPVSLADTGTEIMDGQVHEIDFVSASGFSNKVTEQLSLPNLNSLDDIKVKEQIRQELLAMAKAAPTGFSANLAEYFDQRYGKTAGHIFSQIFHKVYGLASAEVEPTAIAQTSMGRLKFLDDDSMRELKQDPWLDTVLAARRKTMGRIDEFVSIYPSDGNAMRVWCERAVKWLEARGVAVNLGVKIEKIEENENRVQVHTSNGDVEVDTVICSNDSIKTLGNAIDIPDDVDRLQYGTPMIFATLLTQADKVRDFTYLQNFEPDQLTYRTAASGRFSHQVRPDGVSFVTAECPIQIGSENWNNPSAMGQKVWDEVKNLGIVDHDAELVDADIKRIPVTFKLARTGYAKAFAHFRQRVVDKHKRIILRDVTPFFRRDIYLDSAHLGDLIA